MYRLSRGGSFLKRPIFAALLVGIGVSMIFWWQVVTAESGGQTLSQIPSSLSNSGLFSSPFAVATGLNARNVAVGDVSGDGRSDIVVYTYNSNTYTALLRVYTQSTQGTLNAPADYATEYSNAMGIVDINSDGLSDVVVAEDKKIAVYLQTIGGTLANPTQYTLPEIPAHLAFGDVNDDGRSDVVVTTSYPASNHFVGVMLQKPDGTLDNLVTYAALNATPNYVAVGDFTGDGRDDVVRSNGQSVYYYALSVYTQTVAGGLADGAHMNLQRNLWSVAVGDVTGDARQDIVLSDYNNVLVLPQSAEGTLNPVTAYPSALTLGQVKLADVTMDGRLDALSDADYGYFALFPQLDIGGFGSVEFYTLPQYDLYYGGAFDVGDVNGDGYPDIVLANNGLYVMYHTDPLHPPTPTPTVSPFVTKTIMKESFEGVFPRDPWVVTAGGWGKSNCQKFGGSYSAWAIKKTGAKCGDNYPVNQKNWMVWGPFSLYKAKGADLWFNLRLEAEQNKDSLFVGVSRDNKKFYGLSYTGTTGGAKAYSAEWNARTGDFYVDSSQAEKVVRNAPDASWGYGHLDLTNVYKLGNVTGNPKLWFAFVWRSDAENTLPNGAFVDDIRLTKTVRRK